MKIFFTGPFLSDNNSLLINAAAQGIGIMGKTFGLPLPDNSDKGFSKMNIVEKLFSIFTNSKLNNKIKDTAVLALGFLCIGEEFPHTKFIAEKILTFAKDTKDIEIHLTLSEALICCVQGPGSINARNIWKIPSTEYKVSYSKTSDELLDFVLTKMFQIVKEPHPNLRQVCRFLKNFILFSSIKLIVKIYNFFLGCMHMFALISKIQFRTKLYKGKFCNSSEFIYGFTFRK